MRNSPKQLNQNALNFYEAIVHFTKIIINLHRENASRILHSL